DFPVRSLYRCIAFMNSISSSEYCFSKVVGSIRFRRSLRSRRSGLGWSCRTDLGPLPSGMNPDFLRSRPPRRSWKRVFSGKAEKSNSVGAGFVLSLSSVMVVNLERRDDSWFVLNSRGLILGASPGPLPPTSNETWQYQAG